MLGKLHLGLASVLGIGGVLASSVGCAIAQIVPDATLGAESSVITPQAPGSNVDLIQGGATRGVNLFHSFAQFSIPTGREAFFNNALDIQNIISRVTGTSSSNINGLIGSNGTANLFLINPNGIIFGPNASLAIGGSFVGSTASSVNFSDGTVFSATVPQPTPLLTVSVPLGLQFGGTAGSITQIRETNSSGIGVLQVPQGKTLALVGGNVTLDGGTLRAPGGRVELAGVAEPATVGLNIDSNNLSLSFSEGVRLSDVSLNRAVVNVSAINSGGIAVTARNINILAESVLRANRQSGLGSVNTQAGDIALNATEATAMANSLVENLVLTGAVGDGGNINITTGSLSLTNGAQINASTNTGRQGNAGIVNINANDAVSLDGVDSGIFGRVETGAVGNGGSINITSTAGSVYVTNGAQISATTGGQGNAGSVTVNGDTVSLDGDESRIASRVEDQAVGDGGNIDIKAGSVSLTNGARLAGSMSGQGNAASIKIAARDTVSFDGQSNDGQRSGASSSVARRAQGVTAGVGNGGDIEIATGSLFVKNGAEVNSSTFGDGDAGRVTITASNAVSIDGTGIRDGRIISSRVSSSVDPQAGGDAGQVNIKADSLSVINGGAVNVSNASAQGLGDAGELKVEAGELLLDEGRLTASITTSGNGGSINLQVRDLILMRRQGLISATAGGAGNGGNVTIGNATNAPLVVAFAAENTDIIAQASAGQGGKIDIFTQGIFGLEARNPTTPQTSDINASSEVGIDGTVAINRLDIDPSQGLVALPTELVDVSNQIAAGCAAGSESVASNKFIITGRGGLPPSPTEPLNGETVLTHWATLKSGVENRSSAEKTATVTSEIAPNQIVEANGWAIAPNGQVILTASATVTPNSSSLIPTSCNGS